LVVKIFEDF